MPTRWADGAHLQGPHGYARSAAMAATQDCHSDRHASGRPKQQRDSMAACVGYAARVAFWCVLSWLRGFTAGAGVPDTSSLEVAANRGKE
jgi:hypothetical protein